MVEMHGVHNTCQGRMRRPREPWSEVKWVDKGCTTFPALRLAGPSSLGSRQAVSQRTTHLRAHYRVSSDPDSGAQPQVGLELNLTSTTAFAPV